MNDNKRPLTETEVFLLQALEQIIGIHDDKDCKCIHCVITRQSLAVANQSLGRCPICGRMDENHLLDMKHNR